MTVSGVPETVTFAAALLDIFDKTVTASMQEYDVLGNSPAAYFICSFLIKRQVKAQKYGTISIRSRSVFFLKNHPLLKLLRLVVWRRLAHRQFNGMILLFSNHQHPHRAL